ncbi:MAG TPA: hemolysin family protein [Acidimicrobiales bacterium]|nr:hemolysin family protein [Acidimicrobiales bacterium]
MTTAETLMLVAVFVLIGAAAILAMSETALTRINRVKALTLAEEKRRGSQALVRLVEHPERFLNPILLLVLLCHLVAATLIGVIAERLFGPVGVAIATAFEVVVVFVLAESLPKTFAVQHPDRAALLTAPIVSTIVRFPPIRLLARALIGLTNIIIPGRGLKEGPYISEQELLALADVAVEEDVIEREERQLIHSIIEFGDTVVREVMIPRPDMVAIEARATVNDAMEVVMAAGFSRIPVYEQGIDDVNGLLYAKDLMRAVRDKRGDEQVRALARTANFVPETKRVAELLPEMQKQKSHMAIVVDEHGGTAGLVTLEDLIEELVGEIVDEYDVEEPPIEPLPGGDVRVNARMPIDELNDLLEAEFPEGDYDTVGGLVYYLLGHVPSEGETVDYDGRRLRAERVQGRRIGRVRISRLEPVSERE